MGFFRPPGAPLGPPQKGRFCEKVHFLYTNSGRISGKRPKKGPKNPQKGAGSLHLCAKIVGILQKRAPKTRFFGGEIPGFSGFSVFREFQIPSPNSRGFKREGLEKCAKTRKKSQKKVEKVVFLAKMHKTAGFVRGKISKSTRF